MIKSSAKIFLTNRNILILIITTIGILPELINVGGFYIRGDVTSQMLPFVYETKRMFASVAPLWSWNTYFGDNFIASYAYYTVFNPFTWINCLFPYKYLGLGFTLVLYLKFLVCGYVAQAYLKKMGFGERLSLIGCLLYTFSSWAISNLYYYMFMEPMILFPFLLIFVERFLRKEKHGFTGLAIAIFAVVTINYYFASVNLIAGTIYFFCRLMFLYRDRSGILKICLKASGCVCLGVICASFVIVPVLMQLKGSPQVSFSFFSSDLSILADRVFWLLYPKTHEGKFYHIFLNWGCMSNAANIAVFGILPALLLFTKKGNGWLKWFTALLVMMYLTPLNGLFSLFTDIYYSRWTYILTLAIILCTLSYIKDYGLPSFKSVALYCIIVYGIFFLFSAGSIYWQLKNGGDYSIARALRIGMDAALATLNMLALLILCSKKLKENHRKVATIAAVAVCSASQLIVFSFSGLKEFSTEEPVMTEGEYFIRGEKYMREGDFSSRTNFKVIKPTGWTSCNFGLVCNRPSIETYHSIQNRRIQDWKSIVSDTIHPKRVFYPANFVNSFEALMSVKDIVMVSDVAIEDPSLGRQTGRNGLFSVYESDHYIPMGFAYDKYIITDSIHDIMSHDSTPDIPKILLSALAIDKRDERELSLYLKEGRVEENLNLDSLVSERKKTTCDRFEGNSRGFDAHINLDSAHVVFFSVVADDGFTAYIDGEPTKIYETNLGFSSVIVPAGSHDITFRYFPPGLKLGLLLSVIGMVITAAFFFKRF